ncbi:hypothetical protein CLOBE_20180 [Clostridium beijerinckii]|nr:hypothetical protein CLOBE_20180 [Clostridium beijerinckii]
MEGKTNIDVEVIFKIQLINFILILNFINCKRIIKFEFYSYWGDVKMFIYILNILKDGARKNKIEGLSNIEIINDTGCISRLANIKRGSNLKSFNSEIGDIVGILDKYKLNRNDRIEILSKFIVDNDYNRILENTHDNFYIKKREKVIIDSISILENIFIKALF